VVTGPGKLTREVDPLHRCADALCDVREWCERWRRRDEAGPGVRYAMTHRPGWERRDRFCAHALPVAGAPSVLSSDE
jgi:hypothetical protein